MRICRPFVFRLKSSMFGNLTEVFKVEHIFSQILVILGLQSIPRDSNVVTNTWPTCWAAFIGHTTKLFNIGRADCGRGMLV